MTHQPELSGRPQSSPRSDLEAAQPGQRVGGVGIGGNIVPDFDVVARRAARRRARCAAPCSCTIISGGAMWM